MTRKPHQAVRQPLVALWSARECRPSREVSRTETPTVTERETPCALTMCVCVCVSL